MCKPAAFIALIFLAAHWPTFGQNTLPQGFSPFELTPKKELLLFGSGLSVAGLDLILDHNIVPLTPNEIELLDPSSIGRFDRAATRYFSQGAKRRSDQLMTVGFILPLTFLIPKATRQDFGTIGVMALEAVLVTDGITGVFKGTVLRTRPYVYNDDAPLNEKTTRNARRSFFSGHTSNYAALSFFTASVIAEYTSNSMLEIVAWGTATTTTAYMGYLRVNAGKHFTSDVMTGYLVGALVGLAIPRIHKASSESNSLLTLRPFWGSGASGLHLTWALGPRTFKTTRLVQ